MSPNGRRAWRAAAKKLRRTLGRRWRSQSADWSGKRWSELVPDLEAHRVSIVGSPFTVEPCDGSELARAVADYQMSVLSSVTGGHITGAWFKRHGITEQGLQKLDAPHLVRVYVGLWGTADGDSVTYSANPRMFTPRSLVGMTQGARKRRAREWMECERLHQRAQDLQEVVDRQMGRRSQPRTVGHTPGRLKQHYRIGQKLRPCPGCSVCARPCHYCEMQEPDDSLCPRCGQVMYSTPICDGSGVLPARKENQ